MLEYLIFAVTFVIVLIASVIYLYPASKKVTTVPGRSPSDAKTGNLGDISKAGTVHNFLVDLHDEYGDLASFWWGNQITISIASPELFKETRAMFDRPVLLFESFVKVIGERSIQFKNGADGRTFYTALKKAYTYDAMSRYEQTIQSVTTETCDRLSKMASDTHIPLMKTLFTAAIKANALVSYGIGFNDDSRVNRLWRAYDAMSTEWEKLEGHPDQSIGDGKLEGHPDQSIGDGKFVKDRAEMFSTMKFAIETHRKNKKDTDEKIFVDYLAEIAKSEDELLDNAVTFFIAGFHTTGLLMTWVVYFLATHEDVQERVYDEIKDLLGDEHMVPSAMSKLSYTGQVLMESVRCSIIGTMAARYQDFDTEIGGHKIAAGTPIVLALGALHHNEDIWPDPTKFDPSRFDPAEVKARHPYAFQGFGTGKRICPGYNLSMYESYVVLSDLLRTFKVKLVEGQVVVPHYGFVTKPTEEIWVTLEKR